MRQVLAIIVAGVFGCSPAAPAAQDGTGLAGNSGFYFHTSKGAPLFENDSFADSGSRIVDATAGQPGTASDTTIGWNFNGNEAAEFEFGFAQAGSNSVPGFFLSNSRVADVPALANLTFFLPQPGSRMVPYLGAGAGGDDMIFLPGGFAEEGSGVFHNENDIVFAWQAFAGWRFRMSDRASLGFGYKYFAAGDPNYPSVPALPGAADSFRTHSVLLTFHLKF